MQEICRRITTILQRIFCNCSATKLLHNSLQPNCSKFTAQFATAEVQKICCICCSQSAANSLLCCSKFLHLLLLKYNKFLHLLLPKCQLSTSIFCNLEKRKMVWLCFCWEMLINLSFFLFFLLAFVAFFGQWNYGSANIRYLFYFPWRKTSNWIPFSI